MNVVELNIVRACDVPPPDTSHFLPWTLDMIYQVEPELQEIAARTLAPKPKRRKFDAKIGAYNAAKNAAENLLGWYARDPRLRSQEAWDCYFDYILGELRI